jgi:hypothetical protein
MNVEVLEGAGAAISGLDLRDDPPAELAELYEKASLR